MAAEMSAVLSSTSAQTLTLGIDRKGRIRQHDRGAGDILADKPGSLLDTDLGELIAGPGDPAEAVSGLIEATVANRNKTTVLSIRTASRSVVDAVVTIEPIRSNDPELLAQVVMRIPPPAAERFVDPALMRNALLDGAVRRIGGALDIEQMAPELVNILVPHFCNAAGLLMLESVIGYAEHPYLDSARRYSRERATALRLQGSMLPTGLSHPASVEVRHRYLPGSKLIEVGGDWYESIALPGGRVALVVGDVAGHGVRAAVTMGRLRTAIKTLTMFELPPAETLQRLDDLMHELGEFEAHFAPCVYAIFDTVDGTCEVASAGHLPPLLVRPDGSSEFLDVSPAPPLGIGASPISSRTLQIEDGSLLVMYTDGLVEKRTEDIDQGLTGLQKLFGPNSPTEPLDDLCRLTLAGVYDDHQRDDIAILMARLRRIGPDRHVQWHLAPQLTRARRGRSLIRRPLRQWGLEELIPVAELVVSELVTNAVRYAQSKISLRLVLEGALFCEILDDSAALPRLRQAADDDERGRGLQVVSQFAQRWGTRRAGTGKVVWCELALPPGYKINAGGPGSVSRPGDDHHDTAAGPSPVQADAVSPA